MRVTLVIVGGKANKGRVSLRLPIVIGRSRDADLTVAHPMISRKHCELYENCGLLTVRDLGSLNGTFVVGEQIGEVSLKPNDRFTIGPLTFLVDYDCRDEPDLNLAVEPDADDEAPASAPLDETLQIDAQTGPPPADSSPPDEQIAIAPLDGLLPDFSAWAGAADQPSEDPPADQPAPAEDLPEE